MTKRMRNLPPRPSCSSLCAGQRHSDVLGQEEHRAQVADQVQQRSPGVVVVAEDLREEETWSVPFECSHEDKHKEPCNLEPFG